MAAWSRLGRLPLETSAAPWASSHAALPIVEPADGSSFHVYLSLRDTEGRARIGRTTLRMGARPEFTPLEPDPVLDLGMLGAFDDSGVTTSSLVTVAERRTLYYTGWMRGVTVPFYLAAGVAVSDGSGPFERVSQAPLLDRSEIDPFLTASPFVMVDDGRWRMWYVSATGWQPTPSGPRHYYHIKYADSADGVAWHRQGTVAIDYGSPEEYAFARPMVVRDASGYRMWYAVRGARYRIGYAESPDGIRWTRHDEQGLAAGDALWESEMVEYPWVFDHDGRRYMLYNGNDYGKTGVGLAIWTPEDHHRG